MAQAPSLLVAAAIGGCLAYQPANAALTVTAAGAALGFSLSTYYSGDASNNYGMLDVTTTASGNVIATSYARSQLETLADVDGRSPGSILHVVSVPGLAYSVATTPAGATYYAGNGTAYYSVNTSTLGLTPLNLSQPLTSYLGMWANPVTGHLISSSYQGLVDIDPVTGTVHVITTTFGFDGVTVTPDGLSACGVISSSIIRCYAIAGTNALVATYTSDASHLPDGTGVITGGALNGYIVTNNNDGTVGVIDPTSGVTTIIASGGTRGDFVGPDLTNGTLFLASADQVERLALAGASIGCGNNCGGTPTPTSTVPEPTTLALLGMGFVSLAFMRRRN
jgi:hypothetical protein